MSFPTGLRVRTIVIDDPGDLISHAHPAHPAVWLRRGDGIAAVGTAWRAEFQGPNRIPDARSAWDEIVAAASIEDDARVPGSGLMAFAAFTFDEGSAAASVLEIPRFVVGRRDGVAFSTEITADGSQPQPMAEPVPTHAAGTDARTRFHEGQMTAGQHSAAISHAIDLIHEGVVTKVVVARDLAGRLEPDSDRRRAIRRLADAYPECWTYAVDGLTGTSPEMLVRVLSSQVAARVLAGTAPRGRTPQEDAAYEDRLRRSTKDQREHRYAIESALAQLANLDDHDEPESGLTTSPEPFTLALPNVWHLASDIRGSLPEGRSVLDLVYALHPTAAVGGTPTAVALDLIRRLEPFDRRRYAGPVGWLDWRGDGEFAIALRGAEIDNDGTVTAFAGGGIMIDSDPVAEFTETELKFRPIREALGIVPERRESEASGTGATQTRIAPPEATSTSATPPIA